MKKMIYWSILIGVVLVFQETIFRFFFPFPEVSNFNRTNYIPNLPNVTEIEPMRYERRVFQSYPDTIYDFVHELNGYGFRDKDWTVEKKEDRKRIMFVGDSFLEGAMAIEDETITDVFDSNVHDDQIETMNLGIIGAGLPEYVPLIQDAVPLFKPDLLIMVLFANDISKRHVTVKTSELKPFYFKPFTPRLFYLIKMVFDGEPLPFRWKSPQQFMPAVPDPMNVWTEREEELSKHVTPEMAGHMKAGKYNAFRINYAAAEEKYLKDTVDMERYFGWVRNYVQRTGTQLAVCYIPSRHQVTEYYYPFELPTCQVLCPQSMSLRGPEYNSHQAMLHQLLNKMGIPFYDFTNKIKKAESDNNHLFWQYDDHMNRKGYQLVGNTLYEWWNETLSLKL